MSDTTRRSFLITASATAGLTLLGPGREAFARIGGRSMNVLFLGGTGFIGPHIVKGLVAAGHTVTLFNRGNRATLFPDLETIVGNRIPTEGPGLAPLEAAIKDGRRWDLVIDTANVHRWTDDSAKLLKDAADRYLYVSSMSAYADNSQPGQDETSTSLATMPDELADSIDRLPYDFTYFGAVKVRSERLAEKHFPGRTTVLRPGLIVGPGDRTHRFTYWPYRVRQGGTVLAPGTPDDPVMFVDVRDLADFTVKVIENDHRGIFNVNGPDTGHTTIGAVLAGCKAAFKSDATFVYAGAEWLQERGVYAWQQMPLWVPPTGEMAGFHQKSIAKAVSAGLRTRTLDDTVKATLGWLDDEFIPMITERGGSFQPGVRIPGITRDRERELLAELAKSDAPEAPAAPAAPADPPPVPSLEAS